MSVVSKEVSNGCRRFKSGRTTPKICLRKSSFACTDLGTLRPDKNGRHYETASKFNQNGERPDRSRVEYRRREHLEYFWRRMIIDNLAKPGPVRLETCSVCDGDCCRENCVSEVCLMPMVDVLMPVLLARTTVLSVDYPWPGIAIHSQPLGTYRQSPVSSVRVARQFGGGACDSTLPGRPFYSSFCVSRWRLGSARLRTSDCTWTTARVTTSASST